MSAGKRVADPPDGGFYPPAGWLILPAMGGEPDDTDLMVQYRNGDIAAFEVLYHRHKGPLYRFFLRGSGNRDLSAELFQEVWTKIVRSKDQYQPAAKFTTYMYTIAHHCLIDHLRCQQRAPQHGSGIAAIDPEHITDVSARNPEGAASLSQSVERFRKALERLPANQRDAFVMREEAGLSLADIALVTGVSTETVKSRLRYAVSKLRQAMTSGVDVS
jgi:RNA polymerase sigma-70 factor (ECF subfamily)